MGIELKTKSGNITLTAPKATGGSVDLSNYYTKAQTDAKIQEVVDAIPEVDLSGYYTKGEVDASIDMAIDAIPELYLTEYATKDYVQFAVDSVDVTEQLKDYAKKEDIPDVSEFITNIPEEYITETELEARGYLTEHQSLEGYAKTEDIPDVSMFQTEEQVLELIRQQVSGGLEASEGVEF